METAARRRALRVAGQTLEDKLNSDVSDRQGPCLPCACGRAARYAGRRTKVFDSVLGPLALARAYYHCVACEQGFFPRDRALGLAGSSLSPAATRMVGNTAARVSFQESSALLAALAGLRIDAKRVERVAEALGREVADDERDRIEPQPPSAPTQYIGLDGTGVPVRRQETADRAGKQPDGSAKTREVKLVTVWTAENRDREGRPTRLDTDPAISPFAQRVRREAERRGFPQTARRVVIGDGAPWIWRLASEVFPAAEQILDIYHAKQHLSDVAKAVHSSDSPRAEDWADQRHDELDAGHIDAILAALQKHAATCEDARKCLEYVESNRQRMRYKDFRAAGLCVGSGVVEAGCKTAVGSRCKRAGMHWTVEGANAILALRCCHLSNRFEDFWECRAAKTLTSDSLI